MLILGIVSLVGFVLLLVIAARRGASWLQMAVLFVTGIFALPGALFGIVLMGFSSSAEDTPSGAILLAFSVVVSGVVVAACVPKLRKS